MEKDGRGWAWVIVAACFWLGFLSDGIQYSFGLLFIEFLREFRQSKATTAWIGSLFLGWLMLGPVVSILIDKFGCRVVTMAGGIMTFVGLFSSVFSTNISSLYVSYGCFGGLGFLLMDFPQKLLIIQYFEKKRSLAFGIATCGSGIGSIVFNPMTNWLIDEYGWRGTLLIDAGLALNCVACGLAMRPFVASTEPMSTADTPEDCNDNKCPLMTVHESQEMELQCESNYEYMREHNGNTMTEYKDERLDEMQTDKTMQCEDDTKNLKASFSGRLLKDPRLFLISGVTFCEGMSYYTPFTFLPDMAIHKGWSRTQAAWLLTLIGLVNTICRVPIGRIADMKCVNRKVSIAIAFCMMGLMSATMPFLVSYDILMVVCVVFAIAAAGFVVLTSQVTADLFDEDDLTAVYGITCLIFGIGALISGPISGALFDASGSYGWTFFTAAAAFVLAGLLNAALYVMSLERCTRSVESP